MRLCSVTWLDEELDDHRSIMVQVKVLETLFQGVKKRCLFWIVEVAATLLLQLSIWSSNKTEDSPGKLLY